MTSAPTTRPAFATRLVVLCQRHPWATSLAVAFAIAGAAGPWTAVLIVMLPFGLWPLVAAILLPGDPPADETPAALIGYPATLLLFPPILAFAVRGSNLWGIATVSCLAIVPLAIHAVVRSRWPTKRILVVATLMGATAWVLHLVPPLASLGEPRDQYADRHAIPMLLPPAVWLACALMAVAARRCRSMTAVPFDHPIVEDFGGR